MGTLFQKVVASAEAESLPIWIDRLLARGRIDVDFPGIGSITFVLKSIDARSSWRKATLYYLHVFDSTSREHIAYSQFRVGSVNAAETVICDMFVDDGGRAPKPKLSALIRNHQEKCAVKVLPRYSRKGLSTQLRWMAFAIGVRAHAAEKYLAEYKDEGRLKRLFQIVRHRYQDLDYAWVGLETASMDRLSLRPSSDPQAGLRGFDDLFAAPSMDELLQQRSWDELLVSEP